MKLEQVVGIYPTLKRNAAALTCALIEAKGRIVSSDFLRNRILEYTRKDQEPDIRHAVTNARRAGVPIETFYGIGYRVTFDKLPATLRKPETQKDDPK